MNTTKRDVQDEKLYFMQNFDNDKKVTRIVIEATIISFIVLFNVRYMEYLIFDHFRIIQINQTRATNQLLMEEVKMILLI